MVKSFRSVGIASMSRRGFLLATGAIGVSVTIAGKLWGWLKGPETTAADLNTGESTMSIVRQKMTVSGPMPDKVGVGDAIVWNDGSNQLAFHPRRLSASAYL